MATPQEAWIIDVLAKGIDLAPLFELMANENVIKVFHAARQDIEIIYNLAGLIPHPVFDTPGCSNGLRLWGLDFL